ncbi:hypothetical protein Geu3261_0231_012 [Komagataeibacter europaeus NBRC 3261]|uniref:Uncharacterized protein n=1 Tax=Komagataeibacter europaeus NBRC 3261 TaxID=1234669 RepID=A0A0D6Q2E4_KOMEU|nr:hypothetical protein Geu3261_0231_012 [Komagataeibacter europaeus NBRC 3261]
MTTQAMTARHVVMMILARGVNGAPISLRSICDGGLLDRALSGHRQARGTLEASPGQNVTAEKNDPITRR